MSSRRQSLHAVWDRLCHQTPPPHHRFVLTDVYASVVVHETQATPREAVLMALERNDPRVDRALLQAVCQPGHVVAALCWLRHHYPDLLIRRSLTLERVPPEWRHTAQASERYQQLRQSTRRWLRAWSHFV